MKPQSVSTMLHVSTLTGHHQIFIYLYIYLFIILVRAFLRTPNTKVKGCYGRWMLAIIHIEMIIYPRNLLSISGESLIYDVQRNLADCNSPFRDFPLRSRNSQLRPETLEWWHAEIRTTILSITCSQVETDQHVYRTKKNHFSCYSV
jgi:hypothetical protein